MKKILLSFLLCAMTMFASAQIETLDIKADLRGDFGLGIGISADLGGDFEFSPSFNYYFWDCGTHFDVEGDFHYNVDLGKKFTLYPVFGLLLHFKDLDDHCYHAAHHHLHHDHFDHNLHCECYDGAARLGVDVGCGIKYDFSRKCAGFIEGKYQYVKHESETYFALGVKLKI